MQELHFFILDLLVNGPSSVAAMYVTLLRCFPIPQSTSVVDVLETLFEMERDHRVSGSLQEGRLLRQLTDGDRKNAKRKYSLWLDMQPENQKDVSWDEIGMWFEITPQGREDWLAWANESGVSVDQPKWSLRIEWSQHRISIAAEDERLAEEKLHAWLAEHPNISLQNTTKTITRNYDFILQNGLKVKAGVKLSYKFDDKDRGSPPSSRAT